MQPVLERPLATLACVPGVGRGCLRGRPRFRGTLTGAPAALLGGSAWVPAAGASRDLSRPSMLSSISSTLRVTSGADMSASLDETTAKLTVGGDGFGADGAGSDGGPSTRDSSSTGGTLGACDSRGHGPGRSCGMPSAAAAAPWDGLSSGEEGDSGTAGRGRVAVEAQRSQPGPRSSWGGGHGTKEDPFCMDSIESPASGSARRPQRSGDRAAV